MRKQEVVSMVGNRPIKKWRSGAIEGCIWSNKREINGNEVEFKTVSISRSYKKKGEDIWRSDLLNLRRGDIPKVMVILQKLQEDLLLTEPGHESSEEEVEEESS